jgi:hypothetical protein
MLRGSKSLSCVIDGPAFLKSLTGGTQGIRYQLTLRCLISLREIGMTLLLLQTKKWISKEDDIRILCLMRFAVRLGLEPPWQNWKILIAPISAKKGFENLTRASPE